jgi:hypothetical protein
MKALLVSCVILASSLIASDRIVDMEGLTTEQKARVQIQVEQMKQEGTKDKTVDQAKQYIELGEMIGKAFGSCARELNVQVNDFIGTPAGIITITIIGWKTIGRDIVHFGIGLTWLIIGLWSWYRIAYMPLAFQTVEYGQGFWIFRSRKVVSRKWDDMGDGHVALVVLSLLAIIGSSQGILWS